MYFEIYVFKKILNRDSHLVYHAIKTLFYHYASLYSSGLPDKTLPSAPPQLHEAVIASYSSFVYFNQLHNTRMVSKTIWYNVEIKILELLFVYLTSLFHLLICLKI